jgi:hypothetical protein
MVDAPAKCSGIVLDPYGVVRKLSQELAVRVWIGLKQDEQYVHEWVGEISHDGNVADAVRDALAEYQKASGKPLWGITIVVDKNPPPR